MTLEGERPRRRQEPSALIDSSYLALAVDRLQKSRAAIDPESRAQLQREALGFFSMEISLPAFDAGLTGWIDALGFLADALIFRDQLEPLRVALIELGRGVQDQRLVATGKTISERPRGGAANTHEMLLRSLAVEAFDILIERSGKTASVIENELETDAAIEGQKFQGRTLRGWRVALDGVSAIDRPRSIRFGAPTEDAARAFLLQIYQTALANR